MATKTNPVETPVETVYNPWADMVEITLPRHPKNEQNFQFVAVNDRRFQVPRSGKPVMVPRPVYEVLMNSQEMRDYAEDRKEEMAEGN
jgi:hypothetical protein